MKTAFAHNVYDRFITLKNTVDIENRLFPDSDVSIACNSGLVLGGIFREYSNIRAVNFNEKPHKIGCVNGCILSIRQLLENDFDVLIFSHDDVSINEAYVDIVKQNINSVANGEFDAICRVPENRELGVQYYMMEVFFVSKKVAVDLFKNAGTFTDEKAIPKDKRGSISPEVWLFNQFNGRGLKIKENVFNNEITNNNYNEILGHQMGYYHKNIGIRGWGD